jgi:hypothetical protein
MRPASALLIGVLLAATAAHAADVQAVLAPLRNHIQDSDFRATGQLVQVDANGKRVSYPINIKGLWFAGAMHTLVDVVHSGGAGAPARQEEHVRILLEMRPDGRDTIRIFRPHESAPAALPIEKWGESFWGTAFSYEDLLEPQYFWPGQTILKSAVFGSHQCDVLKSTPGPSDRTDYSEVQTWLDHAIDYPVYAEKTMKQGAIVKEFTYYGLRQSSGVWSATQVEAKIRGRAGSTFLIVKRGSAKAHLSANDFRPEQISHFEDRP